MKKNSKKSIKKVVTKSSFKVQPLGDRILLRPISQDDLHKKTASGIFIPETVDKAKPERGEVIAIGDGWYTKDGKTVPLRVKVGDIVIFSKYGYDDIKVDGEELYILKEDAILAVVK